MPIVALVSVFVFYYSPVHSLQVSTHLSFHTFIETLSVSLSFMIFIFQISIHSKKKNFTTLMLGCTFLAVGSFDLFHVLSYKGMPDFLSTNGVEKAIYFWLGGRLSQTIGFLVLAMAPKLSITNLKFNISLFVTSSAIAFASWIIFYHMDALPRVFISGQGLLPTKIYFEYTLLTINLITAGLLFSKSLKDKTEKVTLANAVLLMVVTEFCFTLYKEHDDVMNFWGHILKAFSFIYVYRAILLTDLLVPYEEIEAVKKELDGKIENLSTLEAELEPQEK